MNPGGTVVPVVTTRSAAAAAAPGAATATAATQASQARIDGDMRCFWLGQVKVVGFFGLEGLAMYSYCEFVKL